MTGSVPARVRDRADPADTADRADPADTADTADRAEPGRWTWRIERWCGVAGWVVVVLGVALRVRQWLPGRSFWTDEAALWLATHNLDAGELVDPLRLGQAAPIGWLWAEHWVMAVFGDGERAARLLPLLFGCGALVLATLLARRVLGPPAALAATVLVAVSPQLVSYSNEFKQYSSDVFWAMLLALLGVALAQREVLRARSAAVLGLTMAVAVWFSHAAVLTGSGVLAALGLLAVARRQWRRLLLLVAAAVPLVASIGVDYAVALSQTVQNDGLQTYWEGGFPPEPLRPGSFASWLLHSGPRLLEQPVVLPHPLLVVILLVAGTAVLAVRRPRALLVLLMPLLVLLAAAVAHSYPAADRLVLFAVPTVLLVLAAPVDLLRRCSTRTGTVTAAGLAVAAVAGLTVLTAPGVQQAGSYAVHPLEKEETRPVLAEIAAQLRPGDLVLFDWYAYPVLVYGPRVGLSRSVVRVVTGPYPGCRSGSTETRLAKSYQRVWLAWGHQFTQVPPENRDGYRAHLATVGRKVDSIRATGAGADLYDLTLPADDPDRTSPLLTGTSTRCLTISNRF